MKYSKRVILRDSKAIQRKEFYSVFEKKGLIFSNIITERIPHYENYGFSF